MYTFLTSILLSMSLLSDIPYSVIETAFNSADSAKIVSFGKDKILVKVESKEGVYPQAQTTQILKEFFLKNPVTSFKFSYKGKETDEIVTSIGNYNSKNGLFRVTLKWKKWNGDLRIESLSIEK